MTLNRSISKHIKRSMTSVGSIRGSSSSSSSSSMSVGKGANQQDPRERERNDGKEKDTQGNRLSRNDGKEKDTQGNRLSITHLTLQTDNSQADLEDRLASYSRSTSKSYSPGSLASAALTTPTLSSSSSVSARSDRQTMNDPTLRSDSLPSLTSPADSTSDSSFSDGCESVVEEEPFAATRRMTARLARMKAQSRPLSIISDDLSVYNVPFTGLISGQKQVEMDYGLPDGFYKVDVEEYLRDLTLTVHA